MSTSILYPTSLYPHHAATPRAAGHRFRVSEQIVFTALMFMIRFAVFASILLWPWETAE